MYKIQKDNIQNNMQNNIQSNTSNNTQIHLHNSVHRYVHSYLQHTLQNRTPNDTQTRQCMAQNDIKNIEYVQVQRQIDALQSAVSELSKLFHQNAYCPNCRTIHVKMNPKQH